MRMRMRRVKTEIRVALKSSYAAPFRQKHAWRNFITNHRKSTTKKWPVIIDIWVDLHTCIPGTKHHTKTCKQFLDLHTKV